MLRKQRVSLELLSYEYCTLFQYGIKQKVVPKFFSQALAFLEIDHLESVSISECVCDVGDTCEVRRFGVMGSCVVPVVTSIFYGRERRKWGWGSVG